MLDLAERDRVASRFGVASAQIERDYVLSLLLSALAGQFVDEVIFFGGTALLDSRCRVHCCAATVG